MNDTIRQLRHELGIAAVYAWELRQMISEALSQGAMGNADLAERVTQLDAWLEHWRETGRLIRI